MLGRWQLVVVLGWVGACGDDEPAGRDDDGGERDAAVVREDADVVVDAGAVVAIDAGADAAMDAARVIDAGPPLGWRDVAPILARYCTSCHGAGGDAPFALTDYASAFPYARSAVFAASARIMPPCAQTDPSCGPNAAELEILNRWELQGHPER